MADPRFDHDPGAPGRGRGEKKPDGSGGQAGQALGRSRGGFGTKVHGSFGSLGHPVELTLTGGQAGDAPQAAGLLADHRPAAVIADKGYDSDAFRAAIAARGAEAVIPSLGCRKAPIPYDRHLYRERNVAERFWSRAKQYRRVATRYEKKAANFLAFVQVAAVMVMLR